MIYCVKTHYSNASTVRNSNVEILLEHRNRQFVIFYVKSGNIEAEFFYYDFLYDVKEYDEILVTKVLNTDLDNFSIKNQDWGWNLKIVSSIFYKDSKGRFETELVCVREDKINSLHSLVAEIRGYFPVKLVN